MNSGIEQAIQLFRVSTVVNAYHGCRNVTFDWFQTEPRMPRPPYARLIDGYKPGDSYSEGAIDELFTWAEATALKRYLDETHGHEGTTTIERQDLPISGDVIGFGGIAVGGGNDHYMLCKEAGYNIAFQVYGYFDLRGRELVNEPRQTFRPYLLLIGNNPDGQITTQFETQPEARAREALLESR